MQTRRAPVRGPRWSSRPCRRSRGRVTSYLVGHQEGPTGKVGGQQLLRIIPLQNRRLPRQQIVVVGLELGPRAGGLARLPIRDQQEKRPRDRLVIEAGGALGVGEALDGDREFRK